MGILIFGLIEKTVSKSLFRKNCNSQNDTSVVIKTVQSELKTKCQDFLKLVYNYNTNSENNISYTVGEKWFLSKTPSD